MTYAKTITNVRKRLSSKGVIVEIGVPQDSTGDNPWDKVSDIRYTKANCVFLPSAGSELGRYFKVGARTDIPKFTAVAICEPFADFDKATVLRENNIDYKIEMIGILKPADEAIFYYFGIKR